MIPSGLISIWSGAIVDIPTGWVYCDGNNGTPDLRSKFIIGASPIYPVDSSGGGTGHTHAFTGDGHDHTFPIGTDIAAGTDFDRTTSVDTDTGTTDAANAFPPYYALAYIMKT